MSASNSISLDGEWRFGLDPMDQGVRERWFERELTDKVILPGTTDLNARGFALNEETMSYLMEHTGRATEVQVLRTQWPGTQLASRADETGQSEALVGILGQLFEAHVGPGRIVVCGYDLKTDLNKRRAAKAFLNSLLRYMGGEEFQPRHSLSMDQVIQLVAP